MYSKREMRLIRSIAKNKSVPMREMEELAWKLYIDGLIRVGCLESGAPDYADFSITQKGLALIESAKAQKIKTVVPIAVSVLSLAVSVIALVRSLLS